ncbi:hypothetical protein RIF29_29948 [Crotalaria pallida]|uniref:Nucleoporin NSP1-like C-terminal domain-containing protein n=1 Tax=Crotalaria pallida TaxID=3830 RepID=A0AAN9EFQ0_CROPI
MTSSANTSGFSFGKPTSSSASQPSFGFTINAASASASAPASVSVSATQAAASSKPSSFTFNTSSAPLFSTVTTTTASIPATSGTAAASSAPAFGATAATSGGGSSFAGFGVGTSASTASTASFGTGLNFANKSSVASTPAVSSITAPAFATSTSASVAPAISSASTSATQISSSLVVASSSGTTTVSTPVGAAPKLPSEITGKTVEEIIKEWNAELQERTGKFRKQANAIAEWDRRILQNRDVLLKLEIEVAKVVETQSNLERQLELIETHQQEVDKALLSMEEEAERIYKDERGLLLDDEAASTRDAMYEQSELIERELEQMTEQIKSIIQSLNSNQGGELDALDGVSPLDAVVRILNNQLTSLMWIDEKAEEFSSRIQKLPNNGSVSDRELTGPRPWKF